MDAGVIGGILGTVLGVGGGAIGTYVSIKNTQSPEERAFMIRASIIAWLAITLFLILLLVLPHPYHLLMWIPYGILLPLGIMKMNKRVVEIRQKNNISSK